MRAIFMGTPDFSVPALQRLAQDHDVVCVYTQPPRSSGRGLKERPSPVAKAAADLGLMVRHPINFKSAETAAELAVLEADICIVVAYGLILPEVILTTPHLGCLNIHGSLLPRWRGAAPIQRALMSGDEKTGVCIMQMAKNLDTGPIFAEAQTLILSADTTASLHDRLSQMGAELLGATLVRLGHLLPKAQPDAGVTYAHKIDKAEGRINWANPCNMIDRQIRALSPFPGAWCEMSGQRVKLLLSCVRPDLSGPSGRVLSDLTIACGRGAVEILVVQRPGRKPSNAVDFLHGFTMPKNVE
ncbi:MAG: methionyl-tRNA formyltransferase [Paracoccaceae bacterium]